LSKSPAAAQPKPAAAPASPTLAAAAVHAPAKAAVAGTVTAALAGGGKQQSEKDVANSVSSHKESGLMVIATAVIAGGLQLLSF
ncbi:hypothetical protein BG015_011211, partial [Linnemannia schmuckeri]